MTLTSRDTKSKQGVVFAMRTKGCTEIHAQGEREGTHEPRKEGFGKYLSA